MKWMFRVGLLLLVAAAALQFVQPETTNPPEDPAATFEAVAQPPKEVAAIINRSCRDCHTNRTVWPWYSRVSPMSWLVSRDVKQGRAHINFSEWRGIPPEMTRLRMINVCNETTKGEMPLGIYLQMHSEAKLTSQDVKTLCSWSEAPK